MLRQIPAAIDVAPGGQPNPAAVEQANAMLAQTLAARPILLRMRVEEVAATKDEGAAFKVTGREHPLTYRATSITGRAVALFPSEQAAQLGKLQKGAEITVRGTISKAQIHGRGRGLGLTVTIAGAQMQ